MIVNLSISEMVITVRESRNVQTHVERPLTSPRIISFTIAASLPLHAAQPVRAAPTSSLREDCHEICESHEVIQPEGGPPRSHDDERVGLHHVSPGGRDAHEMPCRVVEVNPALPPSSTTVQQLEFLTKQRMERMDYPEKSRRRVRIGCS